MDLALYRAVEEISGRVTARFRGEDGIVRVEIDLPRPVSTIVRARVNSRAAELVELLSNRTAWVGLPAALESAPLGEIKVSLFADASLEQAERAPLPASIGLGVRAGFYAGEMQALQRAVRSLMMSPGTDTWNPSRGGGLRNLRGMLVDPTDTTSLVRYAQIAVDRYNAEASAATGTSGIRPSSSYRVVRMQLLSLRALTRAAIGDSYLPQEDTAGADAGDVVIFTSIGHDLRGPSGTVRRISSAVAV